MNEVEEGGDLLEDSEKDSEHTFKSFPRRIPPFACVDAGSYKSLSRFVICVNNLSVHTSQTRGVIGNASGPATLLVSIEADQDLYHTSRLYCKPILADCDSRLC